METKIKLIIIAVITALFTALGVFSYSQYTRIQRLNDELLVATNNNKAYEAERDSLRKNVIQFQFTVNQLKYSKDSLINRIMEIRKKIDVKDKQISELQYFVSENNKTDSIIVHDTIFQKNVIFDTLITDD